jgi:thiol-disulfide isomerase/thioredoxin
MNIEHKKYLLVLLITIGIFLVVFGFVNFLNNNKLAHIDDLQRKITADLIATETQFELLKTAPCSALGSSVLSSELEEFGRKLDFAQDNEGVDNPDVIQLKKYYSLLQVKDYLLMQELSDKCNSEIYSLLYFYAPNCDDCRKQGYVLTEFKKEYPELRIYSFDSNLDFSVINTFSSLYNFNGVYPSVVIGDAVYEGFMDTKKIETLYPKMVANKEAYMIQEKGKVFILESLEFSRLKTTGLLPKETSNNIFIYEFIGDDQKVIQTVTLKYNSETKRFSFADKKEEVRETKGVKKSTQ